VRINRFCAVTGKININRKDEAKKISALCIFKESNILYSARYNESNLLYYEQKQQVE
jgi:hypothetical protein